MHARLFGYVLLLVCLFHGALVFWSFKTPVLPQPELSAMAAFFVSPISPSSPSVAAVPEPVAERRPLPAKPVAKPSPPQPRLLTDDPPLTPIRPPAEEAEAATASPPVTPTTSSASATIGAPVAPQAASAAPPALEPSTAAPLSVAIEAVRYLRPPQVVYPPVSRRMGETGRVVVRVLIDTQGVPIEATVAEPSRHPRLNEQALQALLQARFEPYRVNGRPMSVTVLAPVVFTLEDRP